MSLNLISYLNPIQYFFSLSSDKNYESATNKLKIKLYKDVVAMMTRQLCYNMTVDEGGAEGEGYSHFF